MKRLFLCFLSVFLCLAVAVPVMVAADYPVMTAESDYETSASVWRDLTLRALYVQKDTQLTSDINPDFIGTWWKGNIPEAGGTVIASTVNMRGFALSPDGRYAYLGIQHGGGNIVRGMLVMETMTGKLTDYVYHYDGENGEPVVPFSYPKGIDTDSRGYVYIGYTHSSMYNVAHLAVARQEDDGTLTEVAFLPVCSFGTPGNTSGTKVGINGVAVSERDGRVYCYVMTNYQHDALYCFDVTDPRQPVLNRNFGQNGKLDFTDGTPLADGFILDEGQYMDIDADGTIYLCVNAESGKDGIAVIEPDGSKCRKVIGCDGVYCVELVGNFFVCGRRDGSAVVVLDRGTGRQIASVSTANDTYGDRLVRIRIVKDLLFVCDAGALADSSNAIYVAPLSAQGADFLDAIVTAQKNGYAAYETEPPATEPPTEPETLPSSQASTDAPMTPDTTSSATAGYDSLPDDPAPTDTLSGMASDTAASKDNGCSSVVFSGGALILLLGCAFAVYRKN